MFIPSDTRDASRLIREAINVQDETVRRLGCDVATCRWFSAVTDRFCRGDGISRQRILNRVRKGAAFALDRLHSPPAAVGPSGAAGSGRPPPPRWPDSAFPGEMSLLCVRFLA